MNIIRKIKIRRLKREISKYQQLYKELYFLHARKENHFNATSAALDAFEWITGLDYGKYIQSLFDKLTILETGKQALTKSQKQEASG